MPQSWRGAAPLHHPRSDRTGENAGLWRQRRGKNLQKFPILVILLTLTVGGGTPAERQDRGPRPPDQTYEFEDGAPAEGQGQARKKSTKKKSGANRGGQNRDRPEGFDDVESVASGRGEQVQMIWPGQADGPTRRGNAPA